MELIIDVLEMGFAPIKRELGYVVSSKSYAEDLRKEVQNLDYEALRVRSAAELARNNLHDIRAWVPRFLEIAEEALKEAIDLLREFQEASKTCCRGTIPDPSVRYQFSRKAKRKTDDIQQLIQGSKDKEISFSRPARGIVAAPTPARRVGKDVVQSTTATASASSASDRLSVGMMESSNPAGSPWERWSASSDSLEKEEMPSGQQRRLPPRRGQRRIRSVLDLLRWSVIAFKHVISSEIYAQDLQKEVGKLACEFDWIDLAVKEANKDRRKVYEKVSNWHGSADKALNEARKLLGEFKKASKTWCRGTLPDPRCHYEFSTKAKDKIKGIKEVTRRCSDYKKLEDISCGPPPPGQVPAPTTARKEGKDVQSTTATAPDSSASTSAELREDGLFESRASMIQKVMDAFANTSNRVVGIYGMGGVGKSTLLVDIEKRIRQEKSFDWIAKADVSRNPDIKRIQGEIAHWLGLTDIKNKETTSGRAKLLRNRLKAEEKEKKKVLIILDNLWEGLDLKSVGIPCGHDNKVEGCKLLLTSRNQRLLQREMGSDREFLLGGLEEEEARALFERTVGEKVLNDEFKPWVEVAFHRCAGVPFLIVAMAKRFKNAELLEWKDALRKMEKFNHEEINVLIDDMLKWSYDQLGEEEKSFLQLCVVYGGSEPSLENLMEYCVSLGIFGEDSSVEEARDKWRSLIRSLRDASLLLDSEESDRFKIHDIIREFVVSVASRDHRLHVLRDKR